jgi:hypothetical protein
MSRTQNHSNDCTFTNLVDSYRKYTHTMYIDVLNEKPKMVK